MRNTQAIVEDIKHVHNVPQGNIVKIQLGNFQRTRRTTDKPYVSAYKGNAICTIPYGEENFEFSFSVRKAQAIQKMVRDGSFDSMVQTAMGLQESINYQKRKESTDIIDLG